MSKFIQLFAISLLSIGVHNVASAELLPQQVTDYIQRADDFRLGEESSQVISHVAMYEDNVLDKTRQYNVYTRPNRESLVVFKSSVEAGQKMLMLQDNFWLQMPKSRRPIRITAMQKLLGEASVGDISSLTWSEDYQGAWIASEAVQDEQQKSIASHHIQLTAKTSSASYQTIDLWLDERNGFPIKADLYLRSGKLAKKAFFTRGERNGDTAVTAMTLFDAIQANKKTVIEYRSITPRQLDDKYYNPSFLARNNTTEL